MTLINKESDLNGEFANRKEPLNGAEPASSTIPGGSLDFNALRLGQDYTQAAGVEKLLTTVPVRKPNKTEFLRVHPQMGFETMLLDLKEDRESYLVSPSLLPDVSGLAVPVSLKLAINRASSFSCGRFGFRARMDAEIFGTKAPGKQRVSPSPAGSPCGQTWLLVPMRFTRAPKP